MSSTTDLVRNKYVSADVILRRLTAEFGFQNFNKLDIYESIGDAIRELGYGLHFGIAYEEIPVDFYRIPYPCDLQFLENVYYKGQRLNLKKKNCDYYINNNSNHGLEVDILHKIQGIHENDLRTSLENQTSEELEVREKLIADVMRNFSVINHGTTNVKIPLSSQYWILPKDHIIETNIQEGKVIIEYYRIYVDDLNVPYILDDIKYINAVLYYCAKIIIQSGQPHPFISYREISDTSERKMLIAKNEQKKFTSISGREFARNWTNLLNNFTEF